MNSIQNGIQKISDLTGLRIEYGIVRQIGFGFCLSLVGIGLTFGPFFFIIQRPHKCPRTQKGIN